MLHILATSPEASMFFFLTLSATALFTFLAIATRTAPRQAEHEAHYTADCTSRLFLLGAGCLATLALSTPAKAQTADVPSFAVATVKPSDPLAHGGGMGFNNDEFTTDGQTLKALIGFAYNTSFGSNDQISGGPNWISSARFDVAAKEEGPTAAALQKLPPQQRIAQVRLMIQGLLADRFKLKVHHETRDLPVYALVLAKSGSRLKPFVDPPATPGEPTQQRGWSGLQLTGPGELEGRAAAPEMLANVIGMQPEIGGRLVIDKTGLPGKYDFKLKWAPEAGPGAASPAEDAAAPSAGPSLFTALQEQLGLRLESTKAPTDVIVIDHVEMPSSD
jgi:uncharacterized protein (TIGR03435 family)